MADAKYAHIDNSDAYKPGACLNAEEFAMWRELYDPFPEEHVAIGESGVLARDRDAQSLIARVTEMFCGGTGCVIIPAKMGGQAQKKPGEHSPDWPFQSSPL